jgi:uncharacterized membrane protein
VKWLRWAKGRETPLAPLLSVGVLVAAYIAVIGTLSLRRHQNLNTNALDLGYTDQAVWNTLHGRPFRFSTYLDAAFQLDIPIQQFKQPDVLLGYHVEPILAAVSLLYLFHDGPETLLWLQTTVIALGAIPVYAIVRHRLRKRQATVLGTGQPSAPDSPGQAEGRSRFHRAGAGSAVADWLPLAFVAIYLLAPPLEAANMSDFHAVALSPALLLAAFCFLETDRPWGFALFALAAALCKEEIGLLVAMMGLWAAIVRRRWRLGLATTVAGVAWFLVCVQVIMPHFSGLAGSAFIVRYGQLGGSLPEMLLNLVRKPALFVAWLARPDVVRYLKGLWLSGGGLSVLHPLSLAMALPAVAINAFSNSDWMRSGGAHYSASIVPFLVIAAAYGVDWCAGAMGRWTHGRWRAYRATGLALAAIGLCVALLYHQQNGVSPLSRRFVLELVTEHARRAAPLIDRVNHLPPEVPISVGSNLYPHVAHRQKVYLFPTVSDAQVILLDVTGPSSPVGSGEQAVMAWSLLEYGEFGVAESDHGFLLLERGLGSYRLSDAFYDVFRAQDGNPHSDAPADFGGLVRLERCDWVVVPVVRPELVVQITAYWQALAPIDEEYQAVFYFWDQDRNLAYVQADDTLSRWFPTWQWQPGQVIRMALPDLPVGSLRYAGVALVRAGTDISDPAGRLVPIASASGQPPTLWENGTILELETPPWMMH